MPEATKISPQEAANAAIKYLSELLRLERRPTVEEVEFSKSTNEWLITLGYMPTDNQFAFSLGQKDYKLFQVKADTGEVVSMKIRKVT
jgi:hypothetical protein